MGRHYRIGKVVDTMGLSSHALKFYERNGLLHPFVNEETGYRYYTSQSLASLIGIRNFRAMGMSIEEITRIQHSESQDALNLYQDRLEKNELEIERLTKANRMLQARIHELDEFETHVNTWQKVIVRPFHFIKVSDGSEINSAISMDRLGTSWIDAYEYADITLKIPCSALMDTNEFTYEFGILLYGAKNLSAPVADLISKTDDGETLAAYLRVRTENLEGTLIAPLRDIIKEANISVRGDIVAICNNLCEDDDGASLCMTILVPAIFNNKE